MHKEPQAPSEKSYYKEHQIVCICSSQIRVVSMIMITCLPPTRYARSRRRDLREAIPFSFLLRGQKRKKQHPAGRLRYTTSASRNRSNFIEPCPIGLKPFHLPASQRQMKRKDFLRVLCVSSAAGGGIRASVGAIYQTGNAICFVHLLVALLWSL